MLLAAVGEGGGRREEGTIDKSWDLTNTLLRAESDAVSGPEKGRPHERTDADVGMPPMPQNTGRRVCTLLK